MTIDALGFLILISVPALLGLWSGYAGGVIEGKRRARHAELHRIADMNNALDTLATQIDTERSRHSTTRAVLAELLLCRGMREALSTPSELPLRADGTLLREYSMREAAAWQLAKCAIDGPVSKRA